MRLLDAPRRPRTDAGAASAEFAEFARAGGLRAAVLGVLAFAWFVHAAVVAPSALGAHPLAGHVASMAILVAALAFAVVLGVRARGEGASVSMSAATADVAPDLSRVVRLMLGALGSAGVVACALGVVAAFALPVVAYDALGYRLPVIAQWLDAGRVAWVASDDPVRNGYPLGQEAISAVLVAATGAMRCASATSYLFVAAGALSIAWLAQVCGVRASLARMGAALFVMVPIAILNAPSGYVDAAFAGAVVAMLCGVALWWLHPQPWHALAAGMAAAHVLALKGTGIAFVVVAASCLGAALVLRALRAPRSAHPPWTTSVRLTLIAVASALPGAFWVLRNVVHTGNPLWPVEVKLAGHTLFRGVASMDAILSAASNTPAELKQASELTRVVLVWLQPHGPALGFDERLAGLGWAFPLFALPALITCAFASASAPRNRALGLVVLMTAGCFVLQPLRWWPRYSLWLWGAGALAIVLQAEALARAGRTRVLACGLGLLTALSIGEGAFVLVRTKGANRALASGEPWDPRHAPNALSWVSPKFWDLGIERDRDVCRGAWKPATDNTNLDGVFAQLEPRPRVHIVLDDQASWPRVRAAWREAGCGRLLLLHGSPVLSSARLDPEVRVAPVFAFDPLFVVVPRSGGRADHLAGLPP